MQTSTLPLGSLSKRFFASVIDGIILAIVESIISYLYIRYYLSGKLLTLLLLTKATGGNLSEDILSEIAMYSMIPTGAFVVICWLYFAGMESRSGATYGKKMMDLQVTDSEGGSISFGRATVRYLAKMLSGAILLLGYLMAFFTDRRQALHDVIAGTLVLDGTQTFVSSYSRPEIAAMTFTGEVPSDGTEDFIDLNKDSSDNLANHLNDPRLHTFGATQSVSDTHAAPFPVLPVVHESKHAGPVDNTFGEVTPDPVFVHATVPTATVAPVPVPVPAPLPEPVSATAPPKPAASPTGKSCPACGAPVGQYQTKCMKCQADLQPATLGKKLFGKF